ncbi:vegetative incompatibility protein HET-E-1 [Triangularia verruculosa]|uniref:Vegetative incompatibility protein HET-E-1 n=1 Tax=Triangularia verruculosa TaxID=2587418 RepID=A0AAN6XNN3_9PEZI|nr:vegetative incompatibility protein HET-E-1 [Triangularia verruculosa]
MRLINLTTFELEEYYGNVPQYAILSHRWGKEELGFQDWTKYSQSTDRKTWKGRGIAKILGARKQAIQDGYHYLWCDTCCIDKSSSAELSENINSMFNYYADAAVCYAYMRDVPELGEGGASEQMKKFEASRWFTRGWTLQELLAPKKVVFFAKDWSLIGTRGKLVTRISNITGIATRFILRRTQDPAVPPPLFAAGVATKMSWLSRRETTRVEDMAYCMLGIFDINMPLLYGEGHKAFTRLQEEIIRVSNDQSIFCWRWDEKFVPHNWVSILSPSPRAFDQSADYKAYRLIEDGDEYKTLMSQLTYSLTNIGLSINLPVVPCSPPEIRTAMIWARCRYIPTCSEELWAFTMSRMGFYTSSTLAWPMVRQPLPHHLNHIFYAKLPTQFTHRTSMRCTRTIASCIRDETNVGKVIFHLGAGAPVCSFQLDEDE